MLECIPGAAAMAHAGAELVLVMSAKVSEAFRRNDAPRLAQLLAKFEQQRLPARVILQYKLFQGILPCKKHDGELG